MTEGGADVCRAFIESNEHGVSSIAIHSIANNAHLKKCSDTHSKRKDTLVTVFTNVVWNYRRTQTLYIRSGR